jgi:hypothetical protein
MLRQAITFSLALLLPAALGAQGAETVEDTPLLSLGRNEVIQCAPLPLEGRHRTAGVTTAYSLQLPQTRRRGELGFGPTGAVRSLELSFETRSTHAHERFSVQLRFSAEGRVELGRSVYELLRSLESPSRRDYTLLSRREESTGLELARVIAERCQGQRPK